VTTKAISIVALSPRSYPEAARGLFRVYTSVRLRDKGGVYYLHSYLDLHDVSGEYQEKSQGPRYVHTLYPTGITGAPDIAWHRMIAQGRD